MENNFKNIVSEYKVDAFDALHFKLIREKEDLETDETFNPDMTHQVFGESEVIFGYKYLNITIASMAGTLRTFVDIDCSEKIPKAIANGINPDNILESLKKAYECDLITSKADFLAAFDEELKFRPYGQLKNGYTVTRDGQSREFVVHYVDHSSKDFEAFTKYLSRMEPFLLFFVDGSSFITVDDRWSFYVLYEKYSSASCPNKRYAFVGYMSVYKFYAYPEHIRPRLSQLLILPPFQKMGHATRLMESLYEDVVPLEGVVDVTVEEPSEELQRIRDFLDCKRCLQLAECVKMLGEKNKTNIEPVADVNIQTTGDTGDDGQPNAKRRRRSMNMAAATVGDTKSQAANQFSAAAKKQLKLSRTQSRRVYQILKYFLLLKDKPDAIEAYRSALLERTHVINNRVRTDAMRGISSANILPGTSIPSPCRNLIKDIMDEQYDADLTNQVNAELAAYEKTATKLSAAIEAGELDLKKVRD